MQLTQKIRINPDKKQEKVLIDLSEKCRLIYNFALDERNQNWKKNKDKPKKERKYISYIVQQNKLPNIKKNYTEYLIVYSKVLQYTLKILEANFKSFFSLWKKGDKAARPPKFKGKQFFTTLVYNQSGFKFNEGSIKLSHKHSSNTKLKFSIPNKFYFKKIYQISVYKKEKKYYISILYEKQEKIYVDNKIYQAFDLGIMKHTAVNSKGNFIEFKNKRPDRYWNPKIKIVQSKRDYCKKGSNRWKRYNNVLKIMKTKSTNQIKEFQHKLSRQILDNTKSNTIIVGDLSVKLMSKKNKYAKGLNYSLQNTGHIGRFVRFLTYKAKLIGKRIVEISERNTSKRCCCGNEKKMPLYKRKYKCEMCGNFIDRDENASVNIMMNYLSQNGLWIAYQHFVDNLRQTGIVIQHQAIYSQEARSSVIV